LQKFCFFFSFCSFEAPFILCFFLNVIHMFAFSFGSSFHFFFWFYICSCFIFCQSLIFVLTFFLLGLFNFFHLKNLFYGCFSCSIVSLAHASSNMCNKLNSSSNNITIWQGDVLGQTISNIKSCFQLWLWLLT
jgi:hypothetical protein